MGHPGRDPPHGHQPGHAHPAPRGPGPGPQRHHHDFRSHPGHLRQLSLRNGHMPKFNYIAVGADGLEVKGSEDAPTFAALTRLLHDRDLRVKEAKEQKSIMQFELTKKKVPRKDLMHFSRQLSAFLKASVPILDAIDTIREEMTNKLFKAALDDIAENVKAGASFAGAAKAHPEVFPPVYLGMLESADMTGNLDKVLDQLSDYLDRELEARRKVKSAMMYPAVVAGGWFAAVRGVSI